MVQGVAEVAGHPEMVASLALVTPAAGAASPLRQLAVSRRLVAPPLIIQSDAGPLSAQSALVLAADPDATAVVLSGQVSAHWTDTVADRSEEITAALLSHLAEADRRSPLPELQLDGEGEIAGLRYQARGSGPPVIFFPLHLAPSQWEPLLPALAKHYCTITLGGPHLGFASILEQRAQGGYGAVVEELIDDLGLAPGSVAVDVGCGTGALTRRLAHRLGPTGRVVGADINAFLLREASAIARQEGLGDAISFEVGSAEALPFPDDSFDAALACTVLDEVDVDRGLAELARVVRPGGRVAVLVRAVDIPPWDSLPLRAELRSKLAARPSSLESPLGHAQTQASTAGSLPQDSRPSGWDPALLSTDPTPGLADWRNYYEGLSVGVLSEAEAAEWRETAARATTELSFLWAFGYHCAVGTKH